jgi:hypothetical protein
VANLTLTIDEAVLRKARIRALEQGTSVNAVVRDFLHGYAEVEQRVAAMTAIIELAEQSRAGAEGEGRRWSREDIYADRPAP